MTVLLGSNNRHRHQSTKKHSGAEEGAARPATMADAFRDDLYDILGLEAGADEKEVARAYKKKSIVHHPDRGGDGASPRRCPS
jgi:DnaJ-domain-containing protein 1